MLKTDFSRQLAREILDRLDNCEGRMSELLIDFATDESEVNYPTKAMQQEGCDEVV